MTAAEALQNLVAEATGHLSYWGKDASQAEQWAEVVRSEITQLREALQPGTPAEMAAFEAWAKAQGYDMHEHPLHYLFMDTKTNAARMGWKAGLAFAAGVAAGPPADSA